MGIESKQAQRWEAAAIPTSDGDNVSLVSDELDGACSFYEIPNMSWNWNIYSLEGTVYDFEGSNLKPATYETLQGSGAWVLSVGVMQV